MRMFKTSLEKDPFRCELLVCRLQYSLKNVRRLGETNLTILPKHQMIMIRHYPVSYGCHEVRIPVFPHVPVAMGGILFWKENIIAIGTMVANVVMITRQEDILAIGPKDLQNLSGFQNLRQVAILPRVRPL